MIYATWPTLRERVNRWWDAQGCPPKADLADYADRQPTETLKAWKEWLRSEYIHWRNAADDANADLEGLEPEEVFDDTEGAFDEARESAEDCRLMFRAVTDKLEKMSS